MGSSKGLYNQVEITFDMEAIAQRLIQELNMFQDRTILIPAPESRFEGHMIRARECKGPEWLQWLRDRECVRVRRDRICDALHHIGRGVFKDSRYYHLSIELIKLRLGDMNEEYFK